MGGDLADGMGFRPPERLISLLHWDPSRSAGNPATLGQFVATAFDHSTFCFPSFRESPTLGLWDLASDDGRWDEIFAAVDLSYLVRQDNRALSTDSWATGLAAQFPFRRISE